MNKKIEENVIRRRFLILVSIIVLVNTFLLIFWYNVLMKPTFSSNEEIRQKIEEVELNKSYEDRETFDKEIEKISKKYGIKFNVIDENNRQIMKANIKDADFFLFNDVVIVNDEVFILTAYISRDASVASMIISMILFQIVVILILMSSIFYATGRTIFNPIQRIVNDIRAYKFGKRPNKNEINTELDIIQNEFVNLVDSLEEERKEQNRIIASISHDIKTPLTSIMGYSTLLDDDNLSKEEIKKYSVKIHEKAIHIKNILGTFDDYLINYDNKKLKLDNVRVKDIVNDLIADYKVELESKNIQFSVNVECEMAIVKVDVLKLKRIFSNIISNSIRYIPQDNGLIEVDITSDEKDIYFKVKDNGPGIDETIIDKVFDPFYTTDQSRKISGLGLSICKEFVELLDGKISLKNDDGLIVTFSIPISYKVKNKKIKVKLNKF